VPAVRIAPAAAPGTKFIEHTAASASSRGPRCASPGFEQSRHGRRSAGNQPLVDCFFDWHHRIDLGLPDAQMLRGVYGQNRGISSPAAARDVRPSLWCVANQDDIRTVNE
jgi:hypothetical protein